MGKYSSLDIELLKEAGYGVGNSLPPIPFAEAEPVPPFPLHCLPPVLSDFAQAAAESIQVPLDMAGAGALTVVSRLHFGSLAGRR